MSTKMTRRDLLRYSALAGSAIALVACAPRAVPATAAPQATAASAATEQPQATKAEATAAPASQETINLRLVWRVGPEENQMVDQTMVAFLKKHPNIKIEPIYEASDTDAWLMTNYAGGTAPDIIGTGPNAHADQIVRKMLVPLQPYLDLDAELAKDLYPVGVRSYTKNGQLMALPTVIYYPGVFINATLFEEAGLKLPPVDWKASTWQWAEMIETAKKLTIDKNNDGKMEQYGINLGHWTPWTYTRMWGKDLISEQDYASGIVRGWETDKPGVYDALVNGIQARADAVYKHMVMPTPETSTALSEIGSMLKTGTIAMEFTGGWAVRGELPDKYKFAAAINPLGGEHGEGTRGKQVWVDPLKVCAQTKHPKESWDFIRFMTAEPEAVEIQTKLCGLTPAIKSAFPSFMKVFAGRLSMSDADLQTFVVGGIEQADTTVPHHILCGWQQVVDVFSAELAPLNEGKATAKEVVDKMIPLVKEACRKNLEALGLS